MDDKDMANWPSPRYGHKYTKYKMCLSIMMVICIKGYLRYKTILCHKVALNV